MISFYICVKIEISNTLITFERSKKNGNYWSSTFPMACVHHLIRGSYAFRQNAHAHSGSLGRNCRQLFHEPRNNLQTGTSHLPGDWNPCYSNNTVHNFLSSKEARRYAFFANWRASYSIYFLILSFFRICIFLKCTYIFTHSCAMHNYVYTCDNTIYRKM